MEHENRNVTEQLEHCNVDKNDNNKEMEKLVEDMEVLKDKVSKMKPQDSVSTQTEPTKALPRPANSRALDRTEEKSEKSINCLVCSQSVT